jgi:hypothetical protein
MKIDHSRSTLTFTRPFLFDHNHTPRALELIRNACLSTSRGGVIAVWEQLSLPTSDLLPHVADTLTDRPGSPAIATAFRLHNDFLQSEDGLNAKDGFHFLRKADGSLPVLLELDELRLIVFRNGVGFLVQRWRIRSDMPDVWLDVQHYGRFSTLERGGSLQRAGTYGSSQTFTFDSLDTLVLDSTDLTRHLPIREVFISGRTLPYVVVFAHDVTDEIWPKKTFLYKLRRLFHARQTHLATEEQEAVGPPHFMQYLRNQWFFASLEGGGFVAIDAPADQFFRNALPGHLVSDYFLLFLFALQQRFTLMDLSAEVARRWTSHPGKQPRLELRGAFEGIRDRLFDFTSRYQFVQLVQRENHHSVYQLWRSTFQTKELYDEVCFEVREMSEYLLDCDRQVKDERVDRLTLLLTVLIGAPSLAIGFWNINIIGWTSSDGFPIQHALGWVILVAVILAVLFACVTSMIRGTSK